MPSTRSTRSRATWPAAVVCLLALAACQSTATGSDPPEVNATPAAEATSDAGATGHGEAGGPADGFPLRLDNCGFETRVPSAPERVVTIKSAATELALALDRADVLVGTAFADGAVPARWAGSTPPVLSERLPSSEVVLAAEPDLVIAGWESNLTAEGAGDRSRLADLGVATYVLPAACQEPQYRPDPLTFDDVFAQITEVGHLLDAEDAASDLVVEQRDLVRGIEPSTAGLTALWYSSGSDTPFVGGGIGAPELIMSTAGLENINAGLDDAWASVSWEAVAAADPDVIVLVDSEWNSADHKQRVLADNPVTAALDAVAHERYLTVPFPASEAGVRTAWAAADLAEQLAGADPADPDR